MPQMGQVPGFWASICGCIGHAYTTAGEACGAGASGVDITCPSCVFDSGEGARVAPDGSGPASFVNVAAAAGVTASAASGCAGLPGRRVAGTGTEAQAQVLKARPATMNRIGMVGDDLIRNDRPRSTSPSGSSGSGSDPGSGYDARRSTRRAYGTRGERRPEQEGAGRGLGTVGEDRESPGATSLKASARRLEAG